MIQPIITARSSRGRADIVASCLNANFGFLTCCFTLKTEHLKGDWSRKSRPYFALFDSPCNNYQKGREMFKSIFEAQFSLKIPVWAQFWHFAPHWFSGPRGGVVGHSKNTMWWWWLWFWIWNIVDKLPMWGITSTKGITSTIALWLIWPSLLRTHSAPMYQISAKFGNPRVSYQNMNNFCMCSGGK